jgi:hypothetical protein
VCLSKWRQTGFKHRIGVLSNYERSIAYSRSDFLDILSGRLGHIEHMQLHRGLTPVRSMSENAWLSQLCPVQIFL